jgi:hypothetical protein
MMKLGRLRWLGHMACIREKKYIYFCWEKLRERRQLGDLVVNGKIIDLAQDRDRWWALFGVVMNLRVPKNSGDFLTG